MIKSEGSIGVENEFPPVLSLNEKKQQRQIFSILVVLSTIEIGAQIVSSDEYSFNKSSIPSKSRVDLRENQFLRLTCVVSRARPAAAIDFSRDVDFRLERNSTIENDDQTFRTIVVVTIRVNRSHDQRSIFCRANQKESLIVESMPILLNVSCKFAPTSPLVYRRKLTDVY